MADNRETVVCRIYAVNLPIDYFTELLRVADKVARKRGMLGLVRNGSDGWYEIIETPELKVKP